MADKLYSKTELAGLVKTNNPNLARLPDDSVLSIAFKLHPEMQSWLAPEPVTPAPPSWGTSMKELAGRAIKTVGGQIGGAMDAAAKPVEKVIAAGPEIKAGLAKAAENVLSAGKVAGKTVAGQISKQYTTGAYGGAGVVKGATMGYVDPTAMLDKAGAPIDELTKKRAVVAGEFLGAALPITNISKGVSVGLGAAGLAKISPWLRPLVQGATTGAVYGAAKKPETEGLQPRAQNALNDAAAFMAFTGTGQVLDKAFGWYAANYTAPGAYKAARQTIIDAFIAKGAPAEKAATMADTGLNAAIETGGGLGNVKTADLVAMRKAVQRGEQVVIGKPGTPNVPATAKPAAAPEATTGLAATVAKKIEPPAIAAPKARKAVAVPKEVPPGQIQAEQRVSKAEAKATAEFNKKFPELANPKYFIEVPGGDKFPARNFSEASDNTIAAMIEVAAQPEGISKIPKKLNLLDSKGVKIGHIDRTGKIFDNTKAVIYDPATPIVETPAVKAETVAPKTETIPSSGETMPAQTESRGPITDAEIAANESRMLAAAKATTEQQARSAVVEAYRHYIERGDSIQQTKQGQMGGTLGDMGMFSTGGHVAGKKYSPDNVVVSLADGRHFVFKLKDIFDQVKSEKAPTTPEQEDMDIGEVKPVGKMDTAGFNLNDIVELPGGARGEIIGLGGNGVTKVKITSVTPADKKAYGLKIGTNYLNYTDLKKVASAPKSLSKKEWAEKAKALKAEISGKTPKEPPAAPSGAQGLASRNWETPLRAEAAPGATGIFKSEIIRFAEKTFNVPIRGKSTARLGKFAGMFYRNNRIIRQRIWGELEVTAHEVAHAIDQTIMQGKWAQHFSPTALKELRALDYDQEKRRPAEGFAEWFRYAMTTGEEAAKAPAFTKEFALRTTGTQLEKDMATFRGMFKQWWDSGALERMSRQIDMRGETLPPETRMEKARTLAQKFKTAWIDEFSMLERMETEAGIDPANTDKITPFELATYSKGKAGAIARSFVEEAAVNEKGEVIGPSLLDILKPVFAYDKMGLVNQAEFKKFLIYGAAKRGINLTKRGVETGFDIDDMKASVNTLKNPVWDKALEEFTQWHKNLNGWLLRAGAYTAEEMKAIEAADPIYVKFARALAPQEATGGAGGTLTPQRPIKGIKGSGRPIVNWVESAIGVASKTILAAQKTTIARTMAEFAEMFPQTYGRYLTKVPAPQSAVTFSAEKLKDFLQSENIEVSDLDFEKMVTIFQQDLRGRGNVIPIVDASGKRNFYEVDKELYATLNGLDPVNMGPLLSVIAPFSRMLRIGAAGLKPSFALFSNPTRDIQTFAMLSKTKSNPLEAVGSVLAGVKEDIFAKPGSAAWRYKTSGGQMASFYGSAADRNKVWKIYDEMLLSAGGIKGKALLVAKHPVDSLMGILNVMEMGPRLAELSGALEKLKAEHPNWSEDKIWIAAFNMAQDVTVNFTRSGRYAKKFNQATAFFNVAIQGPEKVYRSAKANPKLFVARGLAYLSAISLGLWFKNRDKQWYINMPYSYKLKNLWVETPAAIIRIPIPFELGLVFQSLPVGMAEYLYRSDPAVFKGLGALAAAQIPDILPTVVGPVWDVARDKDYIGRPIEGERLRRLPSEERYREYTGALAKELSHGLNTFGIELSPVQLEYLWTGYTGGVSKDLPFLTDGVKEPADLPVIGAAIKRNPERPERQLENFFNDYRRLTERHAANKLNEDEQGRLRELRVTYNYGIKPTYKNIKEAQSKHDFTTVGKLYTEIQKRLAEIGYK